MKFVPAKFPFPLIEFSPGQDIGSVKSEYESTLSEIMYDYLGSSRNITSYRNRFNRTINDGFTFAFIAGWAELTGSPLTAKAQNWLNNRIDMELRFVEGLFDQLRDLKNNPDIPLQDKKDAASAHATAYSLTLDEIFSAGMMEAEPETDLTFEGEDGSPESVCQSIGGRCVQLMGVTQPASWWIKNDLLPARGNRNYDCGCWNCLHYLIDKTGKVWARAN